jgi:hypothetical protein
VKSGFSWKTDAGPLPTIAVAAKNFRADPDAFPCQKNIFLITANNSHLSIAISIQVP